MTLYFSQELVNLCYNVFNMSKNVIVIDARYAKVDTKKFNFGAFKKRLAKLELPSFQTHKPNYNKIARTCKPYQKYKNIIVIANGGSRTSALAYYQALQTKRNKKDVFFLSTMEPQLITELKKKYRPKDTLVMPISKSGTNLDVLEPLTAFWDEYKILPVTSPHKGTLCEVAKKRKWDILEHPEVGGRYSGRSECAYGIAYLMGLDIKAIDKAANIAYKDYGYRANLKQNQAFLSALYCYLLERKGYTEIFAPIYSFEYAGFLPLMIQLIHESTGKGGRGQTIFGDMAPESQHHTNQRFFGGRKNVLGFFIVNDRFMQQNKMANKIPEDLRDVPLRDGILSDIHKVPFDAGLHFDYQGVRENAEARGIPHIVMTVKDTSYESVGWFLSFWHYFTVYSALLRNQNPFDQPEVEAAKQISFEKRIKFQALKD